MAALLHLRSSMSPNDDAHALQSPVISLKADSLFRPVTPQRPGHWRRSWQTNTDIIVSCRLALTDWQPLRVWHASQGAITSYLTCWWGAQSAMELAVTFIARITIRL